MGLLAVSAAAFLPTYAEIEQSLAAATKLSKLPVTKLADKIYLNRHDILPPRNVTTPTDHVDNSEKNKKQSMIQFALQACVARSVPKSEMKLHKGAVDAMNEEWARLRRAKWFSQDNKIMDMTGCWDESEVMEYEDAVKMANRLGETWHFGRLLELCVEKGSELPEGDPNRRWKGRVVF